MGFQQTIRVARTAHTRIADTDRDAVVRCPIAVQLHGRPVRPVGADVRRGAQDVPDNQREDGRQQRVRVRRVSEQGVRNHGKVRPGREDHRQRDAGLRLAGRQSHHVRFAALQVSVRGQLAQVVQGHERIPKDFRQSRQSAVLSSQYTAYNYFQKQKKLISISFFKIGFTDVRLFSQFFAVFSLPIPR